MNSDKPNPNTSATSSDTPAPNTENNLLRNPEYRDPIAAFNSALAVMMSRDKSTIPDTPGARGPYPGHDTVVTKVAELIKDTGMAYYQYVETAPTHVSVETILTHAVGEELRTGAIVIPITSKDAMGVAVALGWAKRLSLVHAFSLGTKELTPEEQQEIQNQKPNKPEPKTLEKLEL